jgi:transcriptional regulator with XRE-family HTH domain
MEQSAPPPAGTQAEVIAERLQHLFAQYKQAHGRKATDQQVADHVRAETGKPCSRHWVRDLRNAANRAPDLSKLEAIASFFGVSRGYLFDDRDTATVADDVETARRVNLLFAQFTEPDGQPATDQQVAEHVAEVTGQPCTAQWVADLRGAKIRAPDPVPLEAVAGFFGVSRRYLFDDTVAAAVEEDIETGLAIKYLEANDIHLRHFQQLRPDQLRTVAALLRTLAEQNQQDRHDQAG